jgi:hypothetical protein
MELLMDVATITGIVIAACAVLIMGMAGLIKTMVVGKLDALTEAFDDMRNMHCRRSSDDEWGGK